jgi:hypothetical protein
VSLRRRHDPQFDTEVYEVKLDDDFLMSSLFTVARSSWPGSGWPRVPAPDWPWWSAASASTTRR